ncbi:MAG: tRNA lysidine(34) synthetase TilS [Clostridia bacterium]|nr:tRNA lysidine(34) synthetase TilS [Clostridia bacterium]
MDKTRPNAGHRPLIDLDGLGLKGKTVLCAVSGGADSVALLCLLAEERDKGALALYAAHFEHGIRGEASLQDMEFVTGLCSRLGVPLCVKRANVPEEAAKRHMGLESCARELRLAFLEEERRRLGADFIALAHHRRDRAETVMMHLLRGSGLAGAAAMPAKSGRIVRPLLGFGPETLREYLISIGQSWREDESNLVADNPRNALRLNVFPVLKDIYPGFEEALCRFADTAGEDDRCLEGYADFLGTKLLARRAGIGMIDIYWDTALKRRAVKRVYPDADYDAVQRALESKNRYAYTDLGNGYRAWGDCDTLFILPPLSAPEPAGILMPGVTVLEGVCTLTAESCPCEPIRHEFYTQALSLSALRGACLRLRRDGDFIRPFGMGGKRKSLGDYLTDRKYPLPLRERLPLIAKGSEILWVPGEGISESARLSPGEEAMKLTIKYHRGE